ncbi:hypothetical protein [Tolypothrix sp. VBCCA 56010]|uniref:hypothetical protein n=1 Tax=Tolypothrix sp. VBCCA 56010 TaxID=3137731 RepID=UPI003D7ED9A3
MGNGALRIGHWAMGIGNKRFFPCPMPDARCPMPDARCPMPHAPCPMPHAPCPLSTIN